MIALFILLAGMTLGQVQGMQAESDREALVARIKESLNKIDAGLLEASEVEAVETELSDVREAHMAAIRDIEELIKQLEYQFMSPPQGGGGGSSSQNQQQQQQQQQRSADDQRGQTSPDQQQGQQEQPAGSEQEQQPTDGQPAGQPEPPSTGEGSVPPDPVGDFQRENTDGRWGLLPPKVQEQLNNMHVDDVPDRYRTWLDAYIRAMRKLEEP